MVLGKLKARVERGGAPVKLVIPAKKGGLAQLGRNRDAVPARILVSIVDGAGNESVASAKVQIGPA